MEKFEKMMLQVIKPGGKAPVYNCMLSIKDPGNGLNFSTALGLIGESDEPISNDYCFRCGSITKLFTATVIFQLIEEGLFRLEDCYFDVVGKNVVNGLSGLHFWEGTDYSEKITVFHLLQHSSGLRDYFSDGERFLAYVIRHPSQSWSWNLVMKKYFEFELNRNPLFVPGNGFHYSDTNYLLLAVLIEQLTKKSLQQIYREQIVTPLGLNDTYLEFFEMPETVKPVAYPCYGIQSLADINTSFDWGGGGLISTTNDLHTFIRSLVKGLLFKKAGSLEYLKRPQNVNSMLKTSGYSLQYGLGIQQKDYPGYSFVGHNSVYGSMLFYEPEKDISIVISLNQAFAMPKAEWLMKKVIMEL